MGGLLAVNKGSIDPPTFNILEWKPGNAVNEKPVVFLNNLGTREGQTSIAGKFLEHFTGYPWLHLGTAGVAYLHEKIACRTEGGNDFGTRLLCHFLKKFN